MRLKPCGVTSGSAAKSVRVLYGLPLQGPHTCPYRALVSPALLAGKGQATITTCFQRFQDIVVQLKFIFFSFMKYDSKLKLLAKITKKQNCRKVSFLITQQYGTTMFFSETMSIPITALYHLTPLQCIREIK